MSLRQFSSSISNKSLSGVEKLTAFQEFIKYYEILKIAVLGKHTYTDKQLSEHIFRRTWKEKESELIFKKHLLAGYNTLKRLDQKITHANINQYEFLLKTLAFDLFSIVKHVEEVYLKNEVDFFLGSRDEQTAREIYDISIAILEFGTLDPVSFYQREIIPVSVFLIRQSIEIYGKRAIGFKAITNERGQRINRISPQVAWDFIKKETSNSNPRIILPMNIDIILKVEKWTNYYIHTGNIPEIYLIENALHFITPLINPANRIGNYKNMVHFLGTTQIKEYNKIKDEFECYVDNINRSSSAFERFWNKFLVFIKIKKNLRTIRIHWMKVDKVDATILSL